MAFTCKKFVRALAVSMGLCGATAAWAADNSFIPTVDCSTKPSAFSTGYDQSAKTQLTPGSTDPQWYVYSSRSGVVKPTNALPANSDSGWVPASVPTTIPSAWVRSRNPGAVLVDSSGNPDADWISPRADGTTFGGGAAPSPITRSGESVGLGLGRSRCETHWVTLGQSLTLSLTYLTGLL